VSRKSVVLLLCLALLFGCSQNVYQEHELSVETLTLSDLQREPARITATLTGWTGVCERLVVRQQLSGKTFHLTLAGISEGPADAACPAIAREYTERAVIEFSRYDLEPGTYRVRVGSLEETFTYPADAGREAWVEAVDVALLESYPVQIVVSAHGSLRSGCDEIAEVTQRLEDHTFFVTILAAEPWGESCPPIAPPFTERVTLETTDLPPGPYTVDVNGVTQDFVLP
jgi:hypothetical protein